MRKIVFNGELDMKLPLKFKKALMLSLRNTLLCATLIGIPTCNASHDFAEETPQPVALRLDVVTCATSLGTLIEELQLKKEVGIYITLKKEAVPAELQGLLKVSRKGVLCTDIRAIYNKNKIQLEEELSNKTNFDINKQEATRAELNLRDNTQTLTAEEKKPLIDEIYQDLGFSNKGHFFRLFNHNKRTIKSLETQNDHLVKFLNGAADLTHVPHQEIIDHLYNHPVGLMDTRNQLSLAIIKEALECFFPE